MFSACGLQRAHCFVCCDSSSSLLGLRTHTHHPSTTHTHHPAPSPTPQPDDDHPHPPRSAPQPHTHTHTQSITDLIEYYNSHTYNSQAPSMQSTYIHTPPAMSSMWVWAHSALDFGLSLTPPRALLLWFLPASLTNWLIGWTHNVGGVRAPYQGLTRTPLYSTLCSPLYSTLDSHLYSTLYLLLYSTLCSTP